MSILTKPARSVFAPKNADGTDRRLSLAENQTWGIEVEKGILALESGGGLFYDTKVSLNADLAHAEHTGAWVTNDATATNNGIYRKIGASGSGTWTKALSLPRDPFIPTENSGAGTANAIVANTIGTPATAAYEALILIYSTEANTGATTIALDGGSARPLVTNTGAALPSGYLGAGMGFLVIDDGTNYRMLSYGDATAIQAAAEAARDDMFSRYLGGYASDNAATTSAGAFLGAGTTYWNTASNIFRVYDGSAWGNLTTTIDDGDVSETKLSDGLTAQLVHVTSSKAALKNVDVSRYQTVSLADTGSMWLWKSGDQSASMVYKSVTSTTVTAATDTFTATAHGLYDTDIVMATTTANGVTTNIPYWVKKVDANNFKLCTSHGNVLAATYVDVTGSANMTFKHLKDALEAVFVVRAGAKLDGTEGAWSRVKGAYDERAWWPMTNAGLQAASDYSNKLIFAAGSETATKIYVKHSSVMWQGEGMFASIVNFTHTSGDGIVNVLADSGALQNGLEIKDMQVNGASLTGSGSIIKLKDFGYANIERCYFYGVQVNLTFAIDMRSTWPQGSYYCSIKHNIFGLMQFGIFMGDGANNALIEHNRFQCASPGGGQCITLDGSGSGFISSVTLVGNITELPGQVTSGIYVGAAVDGLTIIGHRYESMSTGLTVVDGAKHVRNLNPYYEGCATKVNSTGRGLIKEQIAGGFVYGVTGIIENEKPYNVTPVRASVGLYRFTFVSPPASANYSLTLGGDAVITKLVAKTSTYFDLETLNISGVRTDAANIDFDAKMAI